MKKCWKDAGVIPRACSSGEVGDSLVRGKGSVCGSDGRLFWGSLFLFLFLFTRDLSTVFLSGLLSPISLPWCSLMIPFCTTSRSVLMDELQHAKSFTMLLCTEVVGTFY